VVNSAHSGWKFVLPVAPAAPVVPPAAATVLPPVLATVVATVAPPDADAPPVEVGSVVPPMAADAPPVPAVVAGALLPQPWVKRTCDKRATVAKYVTVRVVIEFLAFLGFAAAPASKRSQGFAG
jgi:hypothetical protein